MDPVTQGLLGASFGQAFFARRLQKKSIIIGAAAAVLPDLDIFYGDRVLNFLKFHRGYTHALFIDVITGIVLGWFVHKFYTRYRTRPRRLYLRHEDPQCLTWIMFFVVVLSTHPILDAFTAFGTQLALPFSNYRFALPAVAVIDPFYSIILVITLVMGWRRLSDGQTKKAQEYGHKGLLLSTGYLIAGLAINALGEWRARTELGISYKDQVRVQAFPTLFQPLYRTIVVQNKPEQDSSGHTVQITRIGFVTPLNQEPIRWMIFKDSRDVPLDVFGELGEIFIWFTSGLVRMRTIPQEDGQKIVQLLDLRYPNVLSPNNSQWGLQARFIGQEMLGAPKFFRSRKEAVPHSHHNDFAYFWMLMTKLFQASVGYQIIDKYTVKKNDNNLKLNGKVDAPKK